MEATCSRRAPVAQEDLEAFYHKHYRGLVGVVAVVTGNRELAEECVQEAFVRLIPRWHRIQAYDDPVAWTRRVAINQAKNVARRQKLALNLLSLIRPLQVQHAELVESGLPGADAWASLRLLPQPQREVMVMFYGLDMSVESIAAEVGIPTGTVKSRLSRARQKLEQNGAKDA